MATPENIRERIQACKDIFKKCAEHLSERLAEDPSSPALVDRLNQLEVKQAKFNLWATINAKDDSKSSLFYQLQDKPDAQKKIFDRLVYLADSLKGVLASLDNAPEPSNGFGESDEIYQERNICPFSYEELMFYLDISLVLLFSVIGNSTKLRKYQHRLPDESLKEDDFENFRLGLAFTIRMGDTQRSAADPETKDLNAYHDSLLESLNQVQKRLIRANVVRRNRILWARQHATAPDTPDAGFGIKDPSTIQDASDIDSHVDLQARKFHKRASSVMIQATPTGAGQEYPKCPPILAGVLRCSLCPDLLSIDYSADPEAWRAHVSHDILPYSCIYEHCETPDIMYATSEELLKHMRNQHSVLYWECLCSIEYIFKSPEDFDAHFSETHPLEKPFPELCQKKILEDLCCPLCTDTNTTDESRADINHIIKHLHAFALKSVPPEDGYAIDRVC